MPDLVSAELLLETMAEGAVVLDTDGLIRLWNRAMAELTGYDSSEAIGRHVSWLRQPGCRNAAALEQLLASAPDADELPVCSRECQLAGRDGVPIPVLVNARPIRTMDGTVLGVLQTVTDFRPVRTLRAQLAELRTTGDTPSGFHGLTGRDAGMVELYRLIELAAGSEATVLISGESGTGKGLAAKAIHDLGDRRDGPFVQVNCGALSESILESELFGHVKGAFTGAHKDRVGRFEAATGGTIFLDEIGEIGPTVQVKLLRVLQDREFERVGEVTVRRTDVRIIAATNRDLAADVRTGRFREDLYYRLRVFPLLLPPLRERIDDVPLLVQHFVRLFAAKTGKTITQVDDQAMRALMDYCWPGNVRELANAIEYAFVVCRGDTIELFDLPQDLRRFELRREACMARTGNGIGSKDAAATTHSVRDTIVRSAEQLRALLDECGWNKAEAARRLGISRTAVWKWMKKHGLPLRP